MVPRYMFIQSLNALGQIVMKRANIGAILNCDLQKVGQIKNPGIMSCHVSLLDVPMIKIWR
jgi:hypothetical protein